MTDRRPLREPSDADLMLRAARGDRDAFAHVYRRHQATIFRFATVYRLTNIVRAEPAADLFAVPSTYTISSPKKGVFAAPTPKP